MTETKRAAARDVLRHVGRVRCSGSPGLLRAPAFPSVPRMGAHHPASGLQPAPLGAPTLWGGMAKPLLSPNKDGVKVHLSPFLPNPPALGSPPISTSAPGMRHPKPSVGCKDGTHQPSTAMDPTASPAPRPQLPCPAQGPLGKAGGTPGGAVAGPSPSPGPRGILSFRYFKHMSNASDYALAAWRGGESRPR